MSTLHSAREEFEAEDVARVVDAALEDDLEELARVSARIDAERSRRIAEIERRGTFRRDGALSITAWIASREDILAGTAARLVKQARFLRDVPSAARALASGEISPPGIDLLASARVMDPEAFDASETILVQAARDSRSDSSRKPSRTGRGWWRPNATRTSASRRGVSMSHQRWAGWSASTGTSIRRRGSTCSPHFGP